MGQYQQWLHYHEVDQQLHARLEALQQEATQLQKQIHLLEQQTHMQEQSLFDTLLQNNPILQALATSFQKQATVTTQPHAAPTTSSSLKTHTQGKVAATISPALSAWSRLPNIDQESEQLTSAISDLRSSSEQQAHPPVVPHSEPPSFPGDLAIFLDANANTQPQVELPWWMRNLAQTEGQTLNGPVDQEALRTNHLVQRWVERWHRQASQQETGGTQTHEE